MRKKILDFWEAKLRNEAETKTSLKYFKPQYMSLVNPHPLWTTSGNNPFEVNKSVVVARLLSGRYRCDWLARHWSKTNPLGYCLLCPGDDVNGTIEHMMISCPALELKRSELLQYWWTQTDDNIPLQLLLMKFAKSLGSEFVQFVI